MSDLTVVFGAGPVGTTVARQLAGAGRPVRVVTRRGTGPEHPLVERRSGDLLDPVAAVAAAEGAARVVMAVNAPYRTRAWAETFPRLQANAVRAAAAAAAVLVTAENLYMYGPSPTPLSPTTPMRPTAAKGAVRARLAEELFAAHARGDVRATTVRSGDFFGPEVLESHAGERFVPRVLAGKQVQVFGRPDVPHAFGYLPDVARTLIAAADRPVAWGRAWLTPALTVTQRQLADAVATVAGPPARARVSAMPGWLLQVGRVVPFVAELHELRYQFDRPFEVDASDTERELGVTATDLHEAVAATVAWYRDRQTPAPARQP